MDLGDIAVNHTRRTNARHAARSHPDALHAAAEGDLTDSLADKQLVGFI